MASALSAWMSMKGMSQAELVRESGVSDFTIRKVLAGQPNNYRADRLAKLCIALGMPSDSLARIRDGEDGGVALSSAAEFEERLTKLEAKQDEIATAVAELLERLRERPPADARGAKGARPRRST